MAPITEDTAQRLHDLVHSLNNRIHALESRIDELEGKPKSPAEQMRLILMGPPGAGRSARTSTPSRTCLPYYREGDASS